MFNQRRFKVRDRQHLWDSSSDEETEQQQQHQSNIKVIDLTDVASKSNKVTTTMTRTATRTATPVLSTSAKKDDRSTYIPSTLKLDNPRYSILPAFPTSIYDTQPLPLLLANVPCKF